MRLVNLVVATAVALTTPIALAHGHKHHMRNSMNMMRSGGSNSNPNGTASGPTTLSGTGPSTYGGNNPGPANSARQ
jgi:hypothetical protein